MTAGKPASLKKPGHSYYWRIAVPRSLRKALGRATIGGALHTRDVAEAHARSWVEVAKAKEQFARLQGKGHQADGELPPDTLIQINIAARAYYGELLQGMDGEARRGVRVWGKPELEHNRQEALNG
jgi:hypothetical protein